MDITTSYGNISGGTAGKAQRTMLKTARFRNSTAKYAQNVEHPKNAGDTHKFRRYEDLPVPEAPLSETVDPAAIQPTFSECEVTVEEYGQILELTKKVADMHEDPVFVIEQERCGTAIGRCSQKVDFNALKAGTNVYYSGTATSRATVNGTLANNDLKKITRQLAKDGVEPITAKIDADTGIGTQPVPEAYVGFVNTDLKADLEDLEGWLPVHEYASGRVQDPGELGECEGIRFIGNREAPIFLAAGYAGTAYLSGGVKVSGATACDVYPVIIIGKDSWSRVPLAGSGAAKPIVINPGKPNAGSIMGRKGYIMWLAYMSALITWEAGVARYEVGCTAL